MKKIYSGFLVTEDAYEGNNLLLEDDFGSGLFNDIRNDCRDFGNYVQLRYYISEKEIDLRNLQEYIINSLFGLTDIIIESVGCPTCSYYSVEKATIGGHNLYHELMSHLGKYAIIEISYYKSNEELINGNKY